MWHFGFSGGFGSAGLKGEILKNFPNVNDSAILQFYDPLKLLAKTELLPKVIKYNQLVKC